MNERCRTAQRNTVEAVAVAAKLIYVDLPAAVLSAAGGTDPSEFWRPAEMIVRTGPAAAGLFIHPT